MSLPSPQELIEQAKDLATKGYFVFPLAGKSPADHFRFHHGEQPHERASDDPEMISQMPWGGEADGVGIHTGRSGIAVVDVDAKNGIDGFDSLATVDDTLLEHAEKLHNGRHLVFTQSDNPVPTNVGWLAQVDVKANGPAYVKAHNLDEWPKVAELPKAPGWLTKMVGLSQVDSGEPRFAPRDPQFPDDVKGTTAGLAKLRYQLQDLRKAWDEHGLSKPGTDEHKPFNWWLNRTAYIAARLVAGGELDDEYAYATIDDLLIELGAPEDQWKSFGSGWDKGLANPLYLTVEDGETQDKVTTLREQMRKATRKPSDPEFGANPPTWIIGGWLEDKGVHQIYGPSGEGKSFTAVSQTCHIASGKPWSGHAVKRSRVLYVAAEGADGIERRIRAWCQYHKVRRTELDDWLTVLSFAPQLQKEEHREAFIAEYAEWKPEVVILDTQARVSVGIEENSAQAMQPFVEDLEGIGEAFGAVVMLIHHSGKPGQWGSISSRGSTAMKGALISETEVRKRNGAYLITNTKQKNAPEQDEIWFKVEMVHELETGVLVKTAKPAEKKDIDSEDLRKRRVQWLDANAEELRLGDMSQNKSVTAVRDNLPKYLKAPGHCSTDDYKALIQSWRDNRIADAA
ncbi:AAA family ATPase [Actinomadura sp. 6N118]|uniref:AAA family ATPase n=1 Tax=Actinomadura sp. 6N118 TaxID=3375151 RepID=UPI0037A63258